MANLPGTIQMSSRLRKCCMFNAGKKHAIDEHHVTHLYIYIYYTSSIRFHPLHFDILTCKECMLHALNPIISQLSLCPTPSHLLPHFIHGSGRQVGSIEVESIDMLFVRTSFQTYLSSFLHTRFCSYFQLACRMWADKKSATPWTCADPSTKSFDIVYVCQEFRIV